MRHHRGSAWRPTSVVPVVQAELGCPLTPDACVNVAKAGIEVIIVLRDGAGADVAAAAAQAAMTAVAEVLDQS